MNLIGFSFYSHKFVECCKKCNCLPVLLTQTFDIKTMTNSKTQ